MLIRLQHGKNLYCVCILKNDCFHISAQVLVWAYKLENRNGFVEHSKIVWALL